MINNKNLLKQKTDDLLENIKFVSQHSTTTPLSTTLKLFKQKDNPNYQGYYKQDELSLEMKEQIESLNVISEFIKQNHTHRPPEVNYFLDDSPLEVTKTPEELEQLKLPYLYGACMRDTWSKGHQFFYIDTGALVRIQQVKGDYAIIEYEHQIGILHINDIKVYGQLQNLK